MSLDPYDELFDDDEPHDDAAAECLPCPNCGVEIYEDSQQCPACGQYVHFGTSVWVGRGWWWIVLGLAGILATLYLLIVG